MYVYHICIHIRNHRYVHRSVYCPAYHSTVPIYWTPAPLGMNKNSENCCKLFALAPCNQSALTLLWCLFCSFCR